MNAVIQCLSNTAPLVEYVLSCNFETSENRDKGQVTVTFADLLAKMRFEEKQFVSPEAFLTAFGYIHPPFRRRDQQDAHEFLIYTLDSLHEELVTMGKASRRKALVAQGSSSNCTDSNLSESSIITRLLQGVLRHEIVCLKCGSTREKKEVFNVLSLPIPSGNQPSIQECLQSYFEQVTLTWTEKMFCSFCKRKQDTAKEVCIIKPPRIIIFHFKRFEYQRNIKRKLRANITFPLKNLDLSPFFSPSEEKHPQYNLYAVVNHYGDVEYGHYTAYCKNTATKQWHAYDDMKCSEIAEAAVQTSSAYILFYTNQAFGLTKTFTSSS
ncbi:inactive ubiquitin carboxyl-terminal hydrolase 50 [Pelobates cultripes]|uniref:ubiquitinyl hydrolase 1 n=1 Tax=Pelobates cultripes TaxID=61616 RepID=A0AAD1VUP7_PELCU|nr:inactive ubiquitin carboxyl-terminal hydrolase 50 [Pelobates cultripes]